MINWLFPALDAVDAWLAGAFPGLLRVCLWGALCGSAAMGIYRVLSNQRAIADLKQETRQLRKRLLDLNLEHAQFVGLMKRNLLVSLRFLGRTGGPSLLASVPVLVVVFWLSAHYSYAMPGAGTPLWIDVEPTDVAFSIDRADELVPAPEHGWQLSVADWSRPLRFTDATGVAYETSAARPPAEHIYKRQWWNSLLDSEAGYIRGDAAIEEIVLAYPRRTLIKGAPTWLATWELPFFVSLFVVALSLKFVFRIQ